MMLINGQNIGQLIEAKEGNIIRAMDTATPFMVVKNGDKEWGVVNLLNGYYHKVTDSIRKDKTVFFLADNLNEYMWKIVNHKIEIEGD